MMTETSSMHRHQQQLMNNSPPPYGQGVVPMKPPVHVDSTLPLISINGQANYNPMDSSIQMVKQPIYKYYARSREEQAGGFGTQSTASTLLKHFK